MNIIHPHNKSCYFLINKIINALLLLIGKSLTIKESLTDIIPNIEASIQIPNKQILKLKQSFANHMKNIILYKNKRLPQKIRTISSLNIITPLTHSIHIKYFAVEWQFALMCRRY